MGTLAGQLPGKINGIGMSGTDRGGAKQHTREAFLDELLQAWTSMVFEIRRAIPRSKTRAIGVTSAVRGEGRTSSSIGLAGALAHGTGEQVVLVDADFRNPDLAGLFAINTAPGLYDCLDERCTLGSTLASTRKPNLALVPSGSPKRGADPMDAPFLFLRRLPSLLAQLREEFTYMVFDMPPLLEDANAAGMASELDGVVLITQAGVTDMLQLEEGVRRLSEANLVATANILPPDPTPGWVHRLLKG